MAQLGAGCDEERVVAAARARQVGLYGMAANRSAPGGTGGARLVLGFGNVSEGAIAVGVAAVADLPAG